MEYAEAGKFLKQKRKDVGFNTQKNFIKELKKREPNISCSESYISLIEKGVKSPSVYLLDIISELLKLTKQEKGELLLTYKRVPNDLEFAVRSNLKASAKITNIDLLREKYKKSKLKEDFNKYIRALILEGNSEEAINLLKTAPNFTNNFIDYQERTAKMAAISGNYDFAIQAFNLALDSCKEEDSKTKSDILMSLGECYFLKALKIESEDKITGLNFLIESELYLRESLVLQPDQIFYLDEYARCLYHIADMLQYFYKNKIDIHIDKNEHKKIYEIFKTEKIKSNSKKVIENINFNFSEAKTNYRKILLIDEKVELPEKAQKEAVYFHAYCYSKLGEFEEASLLINNILILDRNWLTFFIKSGYLIMKFEKSNHKKYLDLALDNLKKALDFDDEITISMIKSEKKKELKTLWENRKKELEKMIKENKNG